VELVNDGENSGEKSPDFWEFFGQAIYPSGNFKRKALADWLKGSAMIFRKKHRRLNENQQEHSANPGTCLVGGFNPSKKKKQIGSSSLKYWGK